MLFLTERYMCRDDTMFVAQWCRHGIFTRHGLRQTSGQVFFLLILSLNCACWFEICSYLILRKSSGDNLFWAEVGLQIVATAGHAADEPGTASELVTACELHKALLQKEAWRHSRIDQTCRWLTSVEMCMNKFGDMLNPSKDLTSFDEQYTVGHRLWWHDQHVIYCTKQEV